VKRPGVFKRAALPVLVVTALAGPSAATAATLENRGDAIVFHVDPGELNHVKVTGAGDGVDIADVVPIEAGKGCGYRGAESAVVHCDGPVSNLWFELGDRDDLIQLDRLAALPGEPYPYVAGGSGDDTVIGSDVADSVSAGPGNDTLDGRGGGKIYAGLGDGLWGEEGADTIRGGPGSDNIRGGLGNDRILGGEDYDYIRGDEGADIVDSRDPLPPGSSPDAVGTTDDVRCGPGTDAQQADEFDGSDSCERVERPSGTFTIPPPGAAGPWEDAVPVLPDGEDETNGWPALTLTPGGEAITAWVALTGGDPWVAIRWRAKPPGQALGARKSVPGGPFYGVHGLASDAGGTVVLLAHGNLRDVWATTRAPGGEFGDAVSLGETDLGAQLVTNGNGDMAAVWSEHGGFTAAVRPSGGDFGTPFAVTGDVGPDEFWRAALSASGEVTVVWRGHDAATPHARLYAATGAADGTQSAPQALSSGLREVSAPEVASNDAGDAAVVWNEMRKIDQPGSYYWASDTNLIARRAAGGPFGAPEVIPGAQHDVYEARVAMSDSGLVTVAYQTLDYMGRVQAGHIDEPLARVRTFSLGNLAETPKLVSNHSGLLALFWDADASHAVSTFRQGEGFFSRVEDLRVECEHVDTPTDWGLRVALNEAGQAAVVSLDHQVPYLTTLTDRGAAGRQDCSDHTPVYTTDPEAPGTPPQGTRPPTRKGLPDAPEPAKFRITSLTVDGSGPTRKVRATIRCPAACRANVVARLRNARGAKIAEATKRVKSKKSRVKLSIKLRSKAASKPVRSRKLVSLKATRRDAHGRKRAASAELRLLR
jgi:hypothetical protein